MSNNSFYDSIILNSRMEALTAEVLEDLKGQTKNDNAKIHTLIATIGYGFNQFFSALPNLLVTAEILRVQLTQDITIDDDLREVALEMVEFIFDIGKVIDDEKLVNLTKKLKALTEKMNEAQNESTTDSEVSEDGDEDIS